MIMGFSHLLYILSAIFYLGLGLIFYYTKGKALRRAMIGIFFSAAFALALRGFSLLLPDDVFSYYKEAISLMVALPICISSGFGFLFLYKKYVRKNGK